MDKVVSVPLVRRNADDDGDKSVEDEIPGNVGSSVNPHLGRDPN